MSKLQQLEFRLLTRKIVRVLEWHDPVAEDFPWSYVERTGDGRFELFTTVALTYETHDVAEPISLGMVANPKEAHDVLRNYDHWQRAADALQYSAAESSAG